MNLKNLLLCILTAIGVVSCTSDIDLCDVNTIKEQEGNSEISLRIIPFKDASGSKTRATFQSVTDGNKFVVEFNDKDTFGIISLDEIYNKPLEISVNKGMSLTYTDDVQTIKLKVPTLEKNRYIIYYPYSAAIKTRRTYNKYSTNFRMSFTIEKQYGTNRGEYVASKNNYLMSNIIEVGENWKLPSKILLYPQNSVFKITLTNLPKGNYSKIELENIDGANTFPYFVHGEIVNEGGIPNIADAEQFSYKSTDLRLEDYSIEKAGEYSFYMTAYPSKTGKFRVKVTSKDGKEYYSKEVFPNESTCFSDENSIKAGYGYELKCTLDIPYPVPEEVDLGLPSGLKWANANLGANSPTEFGDYFEWGVTETTPVYDDWWEGHKWRNEDGTFKKYSLVDKKTTLDEEDDAACVNLGNGWRMPTHAELQELIKNCYIVWTSNYKNKNIAGCIVYKAKKPFDKGKFVNSDKKPIIAYKTKDTHIFLPANGAWYLGGHYDTTESNYWSSTVYKNLKNAHIISITPNRCEANENRYARFCHVGIRPVRE